MSKPPTINDVARAVGMHKSTVSLALSGKGTIAPATRDRVYAVASRMGYEPSPLAQRLASGRGNPLVCMFSGALDAGLATEKIRMIQADLSARGMEVPIYTSLAAGEQTAEHQAAQVRQLCRHRPRAIICAAQAVSEEALVELGMYISRGGIVVSYDAPVSLDCDRVVFDREHNAYLAAKCLLQAGHTRLGIGMGVTPRWLADAPSVPRTHRLRGFRRAMEEHGLEPRADWLFENARYERGGEAMARRFLQMENRPTGMCIVNDYVAFGFMVDVMRAGLKVPLDVSIVSHDDQDIASRCPVPMTSATQPVQRITSSVVELLVERLEGYEGPPRTVTVQGELVSRDSVAAPAEET